MPSGSSTRGTARWRVLAALFVFFATAAAGFRVVAHHAFAQPAPSVGARPMAPPVASVSATAAPESAPDDAPSASPSGSARAPKPMLPDTLMAHPHEQRKVFVGAYAFQLPEFDLARNIYLMDFWIWFRWKGTDFDPSKTFELLNVYEGWNVSKVPVYVNDAGEPTPTPLGEDWYYQCFRVDARFSKQFDVSAYPFDEQVLTIAFEDNDQTIENTLYVTDEGTNRIDPMLTVSGWKIDHISVGVIEHRYPTNWGDPLYPDESTYAQFQYNIHIRRPALGYLATTLLPIAVVMLITLIVYLIDPRYFEGRLVLAIMSLLSAVALQLTIQKDLPKTGHMVLLDDVYILSYLTIFVALLTSTYSVHLTDRGEPQRARRVDRTVLVASAVLFFGGTAVLVLIRA